MTIRTAVGPTGETSTPPSRAPATNAAASSRGTTTMLVSTVSGSRPHASASSRAFAWSSASRSTWWSRACSPAAARMPTCRIPPPIRLRRTRASAMASEVPTISEPTGAPRPFDRHTDITSAQAPYDANGTPVATWAFHIRAPSRWTPMPDRGGVRAKRLEVLEREHRAAREVVGVLDRDRGGADEERTHVRGEHRLDRGQVDLAARVAPGAHGQPGEGAVRAELGAGDVRRRLAEHLLPGLRPGTPPRARWPSSRSG